MQLNRPQYQIAARTRNSRYVEFLQNVLEPRGCFLGVQQVLHKRAAAWKDRKNWAKTGQKLNKPKGYLIILL